MTPTGPAAPLYSRRWNPVARDLEAQLARSFPVLYRVAFAGSSIPQVRCDDRLAV